MIKGVNRQIIEVTDTGNIYYERALLVVRPQYATAQKEVLEREAKRMIKSLKAPSNISRSKSVLLWCVRVGMTIAVSSVLSILIYSRFF